MSAARTEKGRRLSRLLVPSFGARMMLPALLLLAALSIFPFLFIVWMSFNDVSPIGGLSFDWVGLENWRNLFTDPDVRSSWMISGVYAWILKTTDLYTQNILGSQGAALTAVILMDVWEWTPLITIIVLAGLSSMPQEIFEAAMVDGANYWQRLRHMVMPFISGVVIVALLIRSMDAIRFFDIIFITTNGGPADSTKIIPIRLYETAFRFFELGYAAAIGLGMLAFSILIANLFLRILAREGLAR